MKLPIATIDTVYHIGSFEVPTEPRYSYEANLLSVSHAPHAWRQIAKLGGRPLWKLSVSEAKPFLLATSLTRKTAKGIRAFVVSQGYAKIIEGFRYPVMIEDDVEGYGIALTRDEAVEEAQDSEFEPGSVKSVEILQSTSKLEKLLNVPRSHGLAMDDYAPIAFAHDFGLAGVWWNEQYAPFDLSAPRGGLFKPEEWQRVEISFDDVYDETLMFESHPLRVRQVYIPIS